MNILDKDLVVIALEVNGRWSIRLIANPEEVLNILLKEENPDGLDSPLQEASHSIFPDIVQLSSEGSTDMHVVYIKEIKKYLLWARTVNSTYSQVADNNGGATGSVDDADSEGADRKRRRFTKMPAFKGSVAKVPRHRLAVESGYYMLLNIERLMCDVVKGNCDLSKGNWPEMLLGPHWYGQDAVDKMRKEMPRVLHGHITEWFTAENVLDDNFKFFKGVITDEQLGRLVRCFYVGKSQQRTSDTEVLLF